MNWGKGIVLVLVLFIAFISTLVIQMISHKVDLVTEDYYDLDLAFEAQYDAMHNGAQLKESVELIVDSEFVVINVPGNKKFSDVIVYFRRPNDVGEDLKFTLGATQMQAIPRADLKRGVYDVEITFKVNAEKCIQRKQLIL